MAKDVRIVPADGEITFNNASGEAAGSISLNGDDLVLSNSLGNILFGDVSSDVYIGDGVNNVDIIFEKSGEIRAETGVTGVTLTIGSSNTTVTIVDPDLTGTPTAPTAGAGANTTQIATTAFVTTAVSNIVDAAPAALNTLNELAAALGDDANFATTTSTALGNRLRVDTAAQNLNATEKSNGRTNLGLGSAATSATTDFAAASHTHSYLPLSGGTMTGALTTPRINLTNDTTNTVNSRITVYESGSTSYGMMLWNDNATSGNWSTMIYGPNQADRKISFGKANANFPGTKNSVDELAYLDLDNGNFHVDGTYYANGVALGTAAFSNATAFATSDLATGSANGLMSATDKEKLDGIAADANNYSLPLGTSSARGGFKIGYTETGKNYPVELSSERMYVNVPWTDTDTTYSVFTATANGLAPLSGGGTTKYLRADGTWQVPPDTNTTYSTATSSTFGLVKIGYTETGKNYPVELSSGKMYVNVPWTDTDTTYDIADENADGILSSGDYTKFYTAFSWGDHAGLYASSTHNHNGTYAYYDHIRSLGAYYINDQGSNANATTAQFITEIENGGAFDSYTSVFKTPWDYSGNNNISNGGTHGPTELAGMSFITWTDNSNDTTRGNITVLGIAPTTGGSAGGVYVWNDQGSTYSPGWREIWTSSTDGSGSGLDADLLDGNHATAFASAVHSHDAATTSASGFMSSTDKSKLNNIAADANNYSLPLGTSAVRGGFKVGYAESGKNYPVELSSEKMYVNVPWTDTDTTYSPATESEDGLMSATDKDKLDGIDDSANNYSLPSTVSFTSVTIGAGVTLSESSDRADLLSINSGTSGWGGLQVTNNSGDGILSLMIDGASGGLYDDQNNDWILYYTENGGVELRYNAAAKIVTTNTGIDVTGNIVVSGNVDGVDLGAFKTAYDSHNHDGSYAAATHGHAASDITSGSLSTDRLPKQELGISIQGNFGQWMSHSTHATNGFNDNPTYWGWTFIQGNTGAPHTASSQWYRGRFSLGNDYGLGTSSGDYWMEIAIPRNNYASNGNMYIRTNENGSTNAWSGIRAAYASDADTLDGNHATAFAAATHSHDYLPLGGGTLTGGLVAGGGISGLTLTNGISGTNFNITGVNQLEIADPGEGIVFKSGASGDMSLAVIDDATDNILAFSGTGATFRVPKIQINDANTLIQEGSNNAVNITTSTGSIDIGSMNASWVHFQANKNIYILPSSGGKVSIDGDLEPYSNNTENLGTATTRWATVYGVTGNFTGDVVAYSDARTKENVHTIETPLDKVMKLRGVSFNRIGEEKTNIGVIAQEIKEVLPEVVHEQEDGMLAVAYGNIVGLLIEAMKEQQSQIEELKAMLGK